MNLREVGKLKVPVVFTRIDGSWLPRQPTAEESQEMARKAVENMSGKTAEKKAAGKESSIGEVRPNHRCPFAACPPGFPQQDHFGKRLQWDFGFE